MQENGTGGAPIFAHAAAIGDPASGASPIAAASTESGGGSEEESEQSILEELQRAFEEGRTIPLRKLREHSDEIERRNEENIAELHAARLAADEDRKLQRELAEDRQRADALLRELSKARAELCPLIKKTPKDSALYAQLKAQLQFREQEIAQRYRVDLVEVRRARPVVEISEEGQTFPEFQQAVDAAVEQQFFEKISVETFNDESAARRGRTVFKSGRLCFRSKEYATSAVARFVTWSIRNLQTRAIRWRDVERADALRILAAGPVPPFEDMNALLDLKAMLPFPGDRSFGCRLEYFVISDPESKRRPWRHHLFAEIAVFLRGGVRHLGIVRTTGDTRHVLPITAVPIREDLPRPAWAGALLDHLLTITLNASLSDAEVAQRNEMYTRAGMSEHCIPELAKDRNDWLAGLRGEIWRMRESKWITEGRIDAVKARVFGMTDNEVATRALAMLNQYPRPADPNYLRAAFLPKYPIGGSFEVAVFVPDFPYDANAAAFAKAVEEGRVGTPPDPDMKYYSGVIHFRCEPVPEAPRKKRVMYLGAIGPIEGILPKPGVGWRFETEPQRPGYFPPAPDRLRDALAPRLFAFLLQRGFEEMACGADALRWARKFLKRQEDARAARERRKREIPVERVDVPSAAQSSDESAVATLAVGSEPKSS